MLSGVGSLTTRREDSLITDRHTLQAEWERLSPEERASHCEHFHDLCAQGIGDTHQFYPLLMPRALQGYVGD